MPEMEEHRVPLQSRDHLVLLGFGLAVVCLDQRPRFEFAEWV